VIARRILLVVALGLLGILAAASIGYASYLVSRDEVGLPVTKLEPAPTELAPPPAGRTDSTSTETGEDRTTTDARTTRTDDDRSTTVETGEDSGRGRGRGRSGGDSSGSGSDNSGSGSDSSGSGSGGSGSGSDSGSGSGSGGDD
jgi:hypothetical protein